MMFSDNALESPIKEGKHIERANEPLAVNIETNANSPQREGQASSNQTPEKTPLLFVDVNLGGDMSERIVVYEGDTAVDLSHRFCDEHGLDEDTREKLEELLQSQISSVLTKIEEEQEQDSNVYSGGRGQGQIRE